MKQQLEKSVLSVERAVELIDVERLNRLSWRPNMSTIMAS